jgi:hypothetical protein
LFTKKRRNAVHCLEVIMQRNALAVEAYYARLMNEQKKASTSEPKKKVHPALPLPAKTRGLWDMGD